MEIIGNGVDIIKNSRIKIAIKNKNFITRLFTKSEIIASKKIKNKVNFFAKRFAAKEAFVKAIGFGFRKNINFKDISVVKNKFGKPDIKLSSKIKKVLVKYYKIKRLNIYLSLADEKDYSISYVIVKKTK